MQTISFLMLVHAGLPTVDYGKAGAQLIGQGNDRFGFKSASGDLDDDGDIDLVVTAPHQGADGNAVYVFFGGFDLASGVTLDATMADVAIVGDLGDESGWSVAVGDVLGDATPDLIIGSPSANGGEGAVEIFEGPLMPGDYHIGDATYVVDGHVTNGYAGWSVTAGDFDGDSQGELVIGACGVSGDGAAYLLDLDASPTDTSAATSTFVGMGETGCSLANAGDFNDDGIDDLVVGSPGTAQIVPHSYAGAISLVYGRSSFAATYDLLNGDPIAMDIAYVHGEATGENFGFDVEPAGDVNNDGYADLLIGAPAIDCTGIDCATRTRRGRVYLLLGTKDQAPGGGTGRGLHGTSPGSDVADLTWVAPVDDDYTGISVAGAGWVGHVYGRTTSPLVNPNPLHYGKVMLLGTGADIAYAIPYDVRPRLIVGPHYECTWDKEMHTVSCELVGAPDPDAPTPRQIVKDLGAMSFGGHVFTGAPGSRFGFEVLGPGNVDGVVGNDLFVGAPHQLTYDAPAGDGEAYVFTGE